MRLVVTRDDYFVAALDVLAHQGHAALKIGSLCRAIGVTTGSFYHYFGGWDGFVQALLEHWETDKTARAVALAEAELDPLVRMQTLKRLALALPHDAETAIRAWGHTHAGVADVQRRVDQDRLDALRSVILGVVPDPREADRLAMMGMSLLVGVQQWRSPVDTGELAEVLDQFEALVLSRSVALA